MHSFAAKHQVLSLRQSAALLAPGAKGAILHVLDIVALPTVFLNSLALQDTSG